MKKITMLALAAVLSTSSAYAMNDTTYNVASPRYMPKAGTVYSMTDFSLDTLGNRFATETDFIISQKLGYAFSDSLHAWVGGSFMNFDKNTSELFDFDDSSMSDVRVGMEYTLMHALNYDLRFGVEGNFDTSHNGSLGYGSINGDNDQFVKYYVKYGFCLDVFGKWDWAATLGFVDAIDNGAKAHDDFWTAAIEGQYKFTDSFSMNIGYEYSELTQGGSIAGYPVYAGQMQEDGSVATLQFNYHTSDDSVVSLYAQNATKMRNDEYIWGLKYGVQF